MVYYGELALDENGKILGLRAARLFNVGAYFVGAALAAGAFSVRFMPEASTTIQTMLIITPGPVHQHGADRRPIAAPDARRRPISPSG